MSSSAPPPTPATFDFAKPFTFIFEDPNWVNKVLIGGLFALLSFVLVGVPFLLGYGARLTRNIIAGATYPLPDWDDLGEYFREGLRLFAVLLLYVTPIVIISVVVVIPAAMMAESGNETMKNAGGCLLGAVWCLIVPFSFAVTLFLPAAMLMAIVARRIGAAFEFRRIWTFIRGNLGNYLLAVVIYLVARSAAGLGFILLCIGIIFTEFLAMMITTYAFAQVYRHSVQR